MEREIHLPDTLAIFPLPSALILPRSRLPLHFFEQRYLQMVDDTLRTDARIIGMLQPRRLPDGSEVLHRIGCAGRITQFSETEDGRYMVTLTGVSRFRFSDEVNVETPYRQCNVNWEGFEADRGSSETDDGLDRANFMALLKRFFESQGLSADTQSLSDADDELLINSLSMLLDFDSEEKQALLEAPSLRTRRETLVTLMEIALRGGPDKKEQMQ
ncbi:MAG: LON peptidase substrate-binding domain-containing protein [Pseudoprimorskyibacter sp.]|nr:LON peptidase substrate-binding domain-containing protein [Pseudoprimorskyibacter sp.]